MTEPAPGLPDGPHRLTVIAHAVTSAASALVFGDRSALLGSGRLPPVPVGPRQVRCGPEPACRRTAGALGLTADPVDALAGPDFGRWTGRGLDEVALTDGPGLAAWLSDVAARPHGGESLVDLVRRLRTELESRAGAAGRSLWVVTPLVARALTVAALAAPADLVLNVDVSFGGEVRLSRNGGRWRLQGLRRGSDPEQ